MPCSSLALMTRCLNGVAKRRAPTKIEVRRKPKYFVILNQLTEPIGLENVWGSIF